MKSIKERKDSRANRNGAFGPEAEFVNGDTRLPELLAHAAQVDAQVAVDRLQAEADKATTLADSLKAQSKVAKRAATIDPANGDATQIKRQGAQDAALVPGATDKAGNGSGAQWTANKQK